MQHPLFSVGRLVTLCAGLVVAGCHGGTSFDEAAGRDEGVAELDATAAQAQGLEGAWQAARLIVMGDSISAGLGAGGTAQSYAALLYHNDDFLYPWARGRDAAHLFGAGLHYINIAHSGDTTADALQHQLPRLCDSPRRDVAALGSLPVRGPTLVVLTLGGNDVRQQLVPGGDLSGPSLTEALANLDAIMDFFADPQRFPDGVSLYLGNVYDVTDGTDQVHGCLQGLVAPGLAQSLVAWDAAYRDLARARGAHVVDLLRLFYGHGFAYADPTGAHYHPRDPSLWLSERDCIHPNNRGHDMLRRAFYQALLTERGQLLPGS